MEGAQPPANAEEARMVQLAMAMATAMANQPGNQQLEAQRKLESKKNSIRRAAASAPKYSTGKNWIAFKTEYHSWRDASGMTELNADGQAVMDASFQASQLLACFTGTAAERVQQIGVNSEAYNSTILNANQPNQLQRFDDYLAKIQELFLPVSESLLARQNFVARKQAASEDIASYISEKLQFYRMAYSEQERTNQFSFLRDQIISGVYSHVVRKRLIENPSVDEEGLRTAAALYVGQERQKFLSHCSDATSLDGLRATSRGTFSLDVDNVPMEINQLKKAGPQDTCNRCGGRGHWAESCKKDWSRLTPGAAKLQTRGGKTAPSSFSDKKKCYFCNKTGHLQADCWKKQNQSNRGSRGSSRGRSSSRGRGRGRGGGRGRGRGFNRKRPGVRDMGEAEGEEEDEFDDIEEEDTDGFLEEETEAE